MDNRESEDINPLKSVYSSKPSGSDQQILSPEEEKEAYFELRPSKKINLKNICLCVPKVLIVDDNSFNLYPIRVMLNQFNVDFNLFDDYFQSKQLTNKKNICNSVRVRKENSDSEEEDKIYNRHVNFVYKK